MSMPQGSLISLFVAGGNSIATIQRTLDAPCEAQHFGDTVAIRFPRRL
jgi:hypothetical protein